jgi:hypothetical protein
MALTVVFWQSPAQGVAGGATAAMFRGDRVHLASSCVDGADFRLPIAGVGGCGAAAAGWVRGLLRLKGGSRKNSKRFWKQRHKFRCQVRQWFACARRAPCNSHLPCGPADAQHRSSRLDCQKEETDRQAPYVIRVFYLLCEMCPHYLLPVPQGDLKNTLTPSNARMRRNTVASAMHSTLSITGAPTSEVISCPHPALSASVACSAPPTRG